MTIRYALPLICVGAAIAVSFAFHFDASGGALVLVFLGAVIASAWFGGPVPGWIAVVLATLSVTYFFVPPVYEFSLGYRDLLWPLTFGLCAVGSNAVSLQRRRVEEALRQARDDLDRRVQERTKELQLAYEQLRHETAERLQADKSRRIAQRELARMSRVVSMGELAASIAHEVNQPLAAIVANANASLNWLRRDPPEIAEVEASVAAIIGAADRASRVIRDVRDMVANNGPVVGDVNINTVVDDVLLLISEEIRLRDIALAQSLDPALPSIKGDPAQLRQVVLNVLMNAIEAMDEANGAQRELIIRTLRDRGEAVLIVVEDSGHGLPDKEADWIFRSFHSTKPRGMGMGLSISRSIVEAHGGRITAAPRKPHGAIFTIRLPGRNPQR